MKKKAFIMMYEFKNFPIHLPARAILTYRWIDDGSINLLDAGCSYGYATKLFSQKSKNTYGVDINSEHIKIAKSRYKEINFFETNLEKTEFDDNFFDCITFNDVLEHTNDKVQSLSELYRILKVNGTLILSVPHKGLFTFLDPYNYPYYLNKKCSFLYRILHRFIKIFQEGKISPDYIIKDTEKHDHYTLEDLVVMLNSSKFQGGFKIQKIHKGGLFLEVLVLNLDTFLRIFLKQELINKILKPFIYLGNLDYKINYGSLSYNFVVKIQKIPNITNN